jgi:ankyrin repeat protein
LQSLLDSSAEGAILHPQNLRGETPLMEAAYAGNVPAMQLLLEKDPDGLNIVNEDGETVLWYAVYGAKAPAIAFLLDLPSVDANHQVNTNVWDDSQITPLMHALDRREYDVASLLIKHPKTDLTFPDHYTGETAIHLAINKGRENLVRDMLECGRLDINAGSSARNWTALHKAAACRDVAIIKLLLAQDGINVNCQSSSGATPLMRTRSPRVLKLLLAHTGIEVDLVDDFGWSALGYAAERGDRGCAWVLLQHGARPDLVDLDGYTAQGRAEQAKQWDMVKFLESHCKPKLFSPSNSAMEHLDLSFFWAMVDAAPGVILESVEGPY